MNITKTEINKLSYQIIGAAIEVHKHTGPGLLESTYHNFMKKELELRGLAFNSEMKVDLVYKDQVLQSKLRCDFLIEGAIILEIKSVKNLDPIYYAQLMTYMKLLEKPKGILINFNVINIYNEGQKTIVNEIFKRLAD